MPNLSPDGQRLAVVIEGGHQDLWLIDMIRRTLSRLTFDPSEEFAPRWTPDSRRLFYALGEIDGRLMIALRNADGSGSRELILEGDNIPRIPGPISPDGQALAYIALTALDNSDIWVLPLNGDRKPIPFVKTQFNEYGPEFSPDGRFLAYVSNESGRFEIYVRPFPGPGPRRQVSAGGGTSPVWSKSSGELFYRSGDAMMAAAVIPGLEFVAAAPRKLFQGEYEEPGRPDWPRNYDVTPDGKKFFMIKPDPDGRPTQARLVLNWLEELKRQTAASKNGKQ
jgi:Tol biopolymer transport system component